jgi:hypothetical protein
MALPNGFQNIIANQPGVGRPGDFAGAQLRSVVPGVRGQLIAAPAPNQPYIGQFAWVDQLTGLVYGNFQGTRSSKIGFTHNDTQAVIVPFLASNETYFEANLPVTLFEKGSFWANFPAGATVGQSVFANYAGGSVYAAASGTSTQVASVTAAIAANTGIMTVSAVGSGSLAAYNFLTGANITTAPGVTSGLIITSQLTGTVGNTGTYQTNYTGSTAIASGTVLANNAVQTSYLVDTPAYANAVFTGYISGTGALTVSSVISGAVAIGQTFLSGGIVPATVTITSGAGASWQCGPWTGIPIGSATNLQTFTTGLGSLAIISTWG